MENVYFREYTDDDYDGFLNCINDFYDDGYPYPEYLDRKNLFLWQQSGQLALIIAVDESGKIVGTVAALDKRDNFYGGILLLLRSVLSNVRGQKIASKQLEYLLSIVKERFKGAKCYYADVMTHDEISQCSLIHRGYTFCGLRCMAYKNEIIVPKLNFEAGTKMTQAVYCKAIDKSPVSIYAPKRHRDKIKSVYTDLGVDVNFLEEENDLADKTVAFFETDERNNFSEVIVNKVGKDYLDFSEKLKALLVSGQTVIAYINMKENGCVKLYHELRKLNFYFTGISPLFENREYLILCQTDNCKENFEDVKIFGNKEQIINYILGGRTDES